MGSDREFLPDRAKSDVDDPDLGAAALEDDAEGGGGVSGGPRLGANLEDWPDDDEEFVPRHQPGACQPGTGSSALPDAQGGGKKRRAGTSLFGSRPKKPKGSAAATKRDTKGQPLPKCGEDAAAYFSVSTTSLRTFTFLY